MFGLFGSLGKPDDMTHGDTIETTYKDKDIVLKYIASEWGKHNLYYYEAIIEDSDVSKPTFFRFWRTPERTAKIACKRVYKLDESSRNERTYPRHTETTLR